MESYRLQNYNKWPKEELTWHYYTNIVAQLVQSKSRTYELALRFYACMIIWKDRKKKPKVLNAISQLIQNNF